MEAEEMERIPYALGVKSLMYAMVYCRSDLTHAISQGAVKMHSDSQSVLLLVQNFVYYVRIKHIDIKYHRIKELVEKDEVELVKVHIKDNSVDALTKTLSRDNFHKCIVLIGLMDRSNFTIALEYQNEDCRLKCGALKPQMVKKKTMI
uniref:Uncharacterized protein LOC105034503 n=1 Tax=Elaeis guineensis var. tenera TaxID=51953 RepID=A0A6I9QG28_ELAGV|nr:uncharacterized protein LOC105034503 [Elaeis guineensis]